MSKTTSKRGRQQGTQILELAIVLPLLCLLLFFVLEGGELTRVHTVLNNSAREGARLLAYGENRCPNATCSAGTYAPHTCTATGGDFQSTLNQICSYIQVEDQSRAAFGRIDLSKVTITVTDIRQANGVAAGTTMPVSVVSITYPYTARYLPGILPAAITLSTQVQFRQFQP